MNVLLRGYFGFGNFGDDLLLSTVFNIIRARMPDWNVVIYANFSDGLEGYKAKPNYRAYIHQIVNETPRLIDWRDVSQYDLQIWSGGGVFNSGDISVARAPLNIGALGLGSKKIYQLSRLTRRVINRHFRVQATRSIAFGVSVEHHNLFSSNLIRNMEQLGQCDYVNVRDQGSSLNLNKLGVASDIGADIAFGQFSYLSKLRAAHPYNHDGEIGIILCAGKRRAEDIIDGVCKSSEKRLKFIFFDENHDGELISRVESYGVQPLVWRPHHSTMEEFLLRINSLSAVATSRFHGAIIAAMLGIPFLVMQTDEKLKSIATIVPRSARAYDVNRPVGDLMGELQKAKGNYNQYLMDSQHEVKNQVERFNEMIEKLLMEVK